MTSVCCSSCLDDVADQGYALLSCCHPLCLACLNAELADTGSVATCAYLIADGLSCGARVDPDTVTLISAQRQVQQQQDEQQQNQHLQLEQHQLQSRLPPLDAAIVALEHVLGLHFAPHPQEAQEQQQTSTWWSWLWSLPFSAAPPPLPVPVGPLADRKNLEGQRDALLVLKGRYAHALQLISQHDQPQLTAASIGALLAQPVSNRLVVQSVHSERLMVDRLPFLYLPWLARDYAGIEHQQPATRPPRRIDVAGLNSPRGLGMDGARNCVAVALEKPNCVRFVSLENDGENGTTAIPTNDAVLAVSMARTVGHVWVTTVAGDVLLYDADTGALVRVLIKGVRTVEGIAALPDGSVAVSCDKSVCMFDPDGTMRWKMAVGSFPFGLVYVPAVEHEQDMIACTDLNGYRTFLLDAASGAFVAEFGEGYGIREDNIPRGRPGIRALSIAYDGLARVFVVGEHKGVSVWSRHDRRMLHRWHLEQRTWGVAVSHDGSAVYASDANNHCLWQL